MKLVSIELTNFQGVASKKLSFAGRNASIYGDNATGKTTIFNAFTWLLFDKASTGAKGFTPKTRTQDGEAHNLEHAVEATFNPGGATQTLTLRKVYKEVYTKKRGQDSEKFTNTNDYFINGVPAQKKEYDAAVQKLCGDAETLKMLTMPDYFAETMKWGDRRKVLLSIAGNISDEDVYRSAPGLADLPHLLDGHTVDDAKKIAKNKMTTINGQLQSAPLLIAEAHRAMPSVEGLDMVKIEAQLVLLRLDLDKAMRERAEAAQGDNAATHTHIRQQLFNAQSRMQEAQYDYIDKINEANSAVNDRTMALDKVIREQKQTDEDLRDTIAKLNTSITHMEQARHQLHADWHQANSVVWDAGRETCPTCHRPLPSDDIDHMREEFNLWRSEQLAEINERGQEVSQENIDKKKLEVKVLLEELETNGWALDGNLAKRENIEYEIQSAHFQDTDDYRQIMAEIADLRAQEHQALTQPQAILSGFAEQIKEIRGKIAEQEQLKGRFTVAETQIARIAELTKNEEEYAKQYEDQERIIYLCELFIKRKITLLDERINGKFKTVRFRLFADQLNGGLKDDCEVMIPDVDGRMVPYTNANNAARINAGLEIIDVLAKAWNITLPIFVDNAESVTRLQHIDAQVIRLVVSEQDKQLRLVVEDREAAHA
jgi:chromosome segregation ATPase